MSSASTLCKKTMSTPTINTSDNKQSVHPTPYIHSKSAPTSPQHNTNNTPVTPHNTPVSNNVTIQQHNKSNKRKFAYDTVVFVEDIKAMKLQHNHTHTLSCILYTVFSVLLLLSYNVSAQSSVLSALGTVGESLVGDALTSTLGSSNALTTGYDTVSTDLGTLVSSASALQTLSGGTTSALPSLGSTGSITTPTLPTTTTSSSSSSSTLPTLSSTTPSVPTTFLTTDPLGLSSVDALFTTDGTSNYTGIYQSQVSVIDYADPNVWRIIFIAQQPIYQVVLHYVIQQTSDTATIATLVPSSTATGAVSTLSTGAMETLSLLQSAATTTGGTFFSALGSVMSMFTSAGTTMGEWESYINTLNMTTPTFNSNNVTQQYNYIMTNLTTTPCEQFVHNYIVYQPYDNQILYYSFDIQQTSTSAIQSTDWIEFTGMQASVNTTALLLEQEQAGTAAQPIITAGSWIASTSSVGSSSTSTSSSGLPSLSGITLPTGLTGLSLPTVTSTTTASAADSTISTSSGTNANTYSLVPATQIQGAVIYTPMVMLMSSTTSQFSLPSLGTTSMSNFPAMPSSSTGQQYGIYFVTNSPDQVSWVDVHYSIDNTAQLNYRMSQVNTTTFVVPISLNNNDVIVYNFTYWSTVDNVAFDSLVFAYRAYQSTNTQLQLTSSSALSGLQQAGQLQLPRAVQLPVMMSNTMIMPNAAPALTITNVASNIPLSTSMQPLPMNSLINTGNILTGSTVASHTFTLDAVTSTAVPANALLVQNTPTYMTYIIPSTTTQQTTSQLYTFNFLGNASTIGTAGLNDVYMQYMTPEQTQPTVVQMIAAEPSTITTSATTQPYTVPSQLLYSTQIALQPNATIEYNYVYVPAASNTAQQTTVQLFNPTQLLTTQQQTTQSICTNALTYHYQWTAANTAPTLPALGTTSTTTATSYQLLFIPNVTASNDQVQSVTLNVLDSSGQKYTANMSSTAASFMPTGSTIPTISDTAYTATLNNLNYDDGLTYSFTYTLINSADVTTQCTTQTLIFTPASQTSYSDSSSSSSTVNAPTTTAIGITPLQPMSSAVAQLSLGLPAVPTALLSDSLTVPIAQIGSTQSQDVTSCTIPCMSAPSSTSSTAIATCMTQCSTAIQNGTPFVPASVHHTMSVDAVTQTTPIIDPDTIQQTLYSLIGTKKYTFTLPTLQPYNSLQASAAKLYGVSTNVLDNADTYDTVVDTIPTDSTAAEWYTVVTGLVTLINNPTAYTRLLPVDYPSNMCTLCLNSCVGASSTSTCIASCSSTCVLSTQEYNVIVQLATQQSQGSVLTASSTTRHLLQTTVSTINSTFVNAIAGLAPTNDTTTTAPTQAQARNETLYIMSQLATFSSSMMSSALPVMTSAVSAVNPGLGIGLQLVGSLASTMLSPTAGGFGTLFSGLLAKHHKLMAVGTTTATPSLSSSGYSCGQNGLLTCLNPCINSDQSVNSTCSQQCTTAPCTVLVNNNQTMDIRQMYNSLSAMSSLSTIYNNGSTSSSTTQPNLSALFGTAPVANIDMNTISNLATTSSTASCSECIGSSVQSGSTNSTSIANNCISSCISLQSLNTVQSSTAQPVSTSFTDFIESLNNGTNGFASILTPHTHKFSLSSTTATSSATTTSNAITDTAAQLMPLIVSGQMLNGANAAFGNLQPLTLLNTPQPLSVPTTMNAINSLSTLTPTSPSTNTQCSTYISASTCTPQCMSTTNNSDLSAMSQCMSQCGTNTCVIPDMNQVNTMRISSILQTAATTST